MKNLVKYGLVPVVLGCLSPCSAKTLEVKDIIYEPTDRTATDQPVLDVNDEVCALVKLPFPPVDASIINGDQIYHKEYHGNEWYIYMPEHTYKFYIKYPGYDALEIDLSQKFPSGLESGKTYKVVIDYEPIRALMTPTLTPLKEQPNQNRGSVINSYDLSVEKAFNNVVDDNMESAKSIMYIKSTGVYVCVGYTVPGISGLNVGFGGYISNVNVEAAFLMSFSKSESVYWNDSAGNQSSVAAQYSPTGIQGMVGYGVIIGNRFRVTPKVGLRYTVLRERADVMIANNANSLGVPAEVKVDGAIIPHFGGFVALSYIVGVSKSEGYSALAEVSKKIKGYSNGIGFTIGVYYNF